MFRGTCGFYTGDHRCEWEGDCGLFLKTNTQLPFSTQEHDQQSFKHVQQLPQHRGMYCTYNPLQYL